MSNQMSDEAQTQTQGEREERSTKATVETEHVGPGGIVHHYSDKVQIFTYGTGGGMHAAVGYVGGRQVMEIHYEFDSLDQPVGPYRSHEDARDVCRALIDQHHSDLVRPPDQAEVSAHAC